ncbi:MAG TPA: hypothetical protein VK774_05915 [Solirubrobacteraceae bacterium]|nr:hypothetical protein [Solirubrobacteraceae bacterium]
MEVIEVAYRELRPPGLKLDAEGAPTEPACLDQCRPDPTHGIEDQVAGVAVVLYGATRERWEHLARVAI